MRNTKLIICSVLFAFCWSGCVRYQPKPLLAERALRDFSSRTLDNSELRDFFKRNGQTPAWPIQTWEIRTLTLVSLFYHPDLDVARAQWGVAQAGRITAGERPNPDFSFSPTYNSSLAIEDGPRFSPSFSLDLTLETAGKRGIRIAQARALAKAAYYNLHSAAWQVYSRLRQRLLDVYSSEQMRALLQEKQAILTDHVTIAEAQHAAGAISAYQVAQLHTALQSCKLELFDAEKSSQQARIKLAAAIGVPSAEVERLAISFADFERYDIQVDDRAAQLRALTSRNDILGALAEYAAAESALKLEIARQYPDLHLGPGYQLDQGQNKWTLGFSFSLPIFQRNRGLIAEAEARRAEAGARFLALQASVISEIESALAGMRVALPQAQAAQEMLRQLTKQEKTAVTMHALGEIAKSELLAIKLELNAALVARLNALQNAQTAIWCFENALQNALVLTAPQLRIAPQAIQTAKEK